MNATPAAGALVLEYPALYETASQLSDRSQKFYLRLIWWEYVLLITSAVFVMDVADSKYHHAATAGIIIASLALMIWRNSTKPEQDWYRGRALAESIKTSVWKYCMRAEPFGDADKLAVRRAEFRNYLLGILEANRHIGNKMPPDSAAKHQVTQSMEATRAQSLEDRKSYYDLHRVREQRAWYAKKAYANKKASRRWFLFGIAAYAIAIGIALSRIAIPEWSIWPVEPVLVLASSVLGWMQVKKFNELAASYTLTAHEIGIIQGKIAEVDGEEAFSIFVNEAEQAFSREHTQWVARQQHNDQ